MRARKTDADGYAERNGVKVYYEVFGAGTTRNHPGHPDRHEAGRDPRRGRRHRIASRSGQGPEPAGLVKVTITGPEGARALTGRSGAAD